jgi:integral membrane protein (TIGR01906 family)
VRTPLSRAADVSIAVATAIVIVALTIPLFLNPVWVGFEQGRAQATAWTGFSDADLRFATDSILTDLVTGPPVFDIQVEGQPVLDERERAHMRDVREVFIGALRVVLIAGFVAVAIALRRRGDGRLRTWRAVWAGAVGLVATLIVSGVIALVAFDALFEAFHRLLFTGGSYRFDLRSDRLVQLFPFQFWQETAIAVGALAIVVALIVATVARRRLAAAAAPTRQPAPATFESSRP